MNNYTIAKHVKIGNDIQCYLLGISENARHCNRLIIPQKQIDEISKYRFQQDSSKRLLARSFLYQYLHKNYGIDDFELEYNQYKKPFLKTAPNIDFSFSYSKDYLLVGISKNKKLGVDIENINLKLKLSELAPEIMCLPELEQFYTYLPGSIDQFHYFFNIFSAKESIIKCFGTGLYYNVKRLRIADNTEFNYTGVKHVYHPIGYWMNDYVLSLCYEK